MWPIVYNHLLGFGSAFGVGWAIRLMDDALDEDLDSMLGKPNWSQRLGGGTTAYALYALALAALLDPTTGLCLLAGAYAVGMLSETRLLPTKVPGYVEGTILMLMAAWRFGIGKAWAALGIMIAAQLIDDLLDRTQDEWLQANNWTTKLGTVGTILVCLALLAALFYLDTWLLAYAALTFTLFQLQERVSRRG